MSTINKNLFILVFYLFTINSNTAQIDFDSIHYIDESYTIPTSIFSIDFDYDGDIDILASSWSDTLALFLNKGSGKFDSPIIIENTLDNIKPLVVCDLDLDGDYDILSASYNDEIIVWIENLGNYVFSTPNIIASSLENITFVAGYDMDNDGDVDVIGSFYDRISWFENDGNCNFDNEIVIHNINPQRSLCFSDVDDDGDIDILTKIKFSTNAVLWFQNNGDKTFTKDSIEVPFDFQFTLLANTFDLNNDNKDDFILSVTTDYYDKEAIFINTGNGNFDFSGALGIENPQFISSYDFDSDGDGDMIIYSSWDNRLIFVENNDMLFQEKYIKQRVSFGRALSNGDFDNDGDRDILVSSSTGFFWMENLLLEILNQPKNSTVCAYKNAIFSVSAKDANCYKWQVSGYDGHNYFITPYDYEDIFLNLTSPVLTVTNPGPDMDGLQFRCKVQNNGGFIYTDTVTLSIFEDNEPPSLVTKDVVFYLGNSVQTKLSAAYLIKELSDNCEYIDTTLSMSNFDCNNIGDNIIQVTAVDGSGNSVTNDVKITVVDTIAPKIIINKTIEFFTTGNEYKIASSLADPDLVYDNCGVKSYYNNINGLETLKGAVFSSGNNKVEWYAEDIYDNMSKVLINVLITNENSYSVFPNPFRDYIIITQEYEGNYSLNVINGRGKTVYSVENVTDIWFPINLNFLKEGLYILKIVSGDKVTIFKIIKVNP